MASVRLWSFIFGGLTLVTIVVEVGLDLSAEKLENIIIISALDLLNTQTCKLN